MELRLLNSFVLAAKTLSFSEAAEIQCINQSTFSQNIRQLEDELGVALFYRNSHGVSLTDAGREFLPFARKTLSYVEDGVARMEDLRNLRYGLLNIGVTHSFGMLIEEVLARFTAQFPSVKINLFYKTAEDMPSMLRNREIDMALTYRSMEDNADIVSQTLFEDRLSVIVPRNHVLATMEQVPVECLTRHPLVLPARGVNARTVLDTIAAKYHLSLNACIEIDQVTPLMRLVLTGRYITALSSTSIDSVQGLVALPINLPEARMYGSVHVLGDSYKKASGVEFVKMLVETSNIRNRFASLNKK
ncbi:MAG: LysR family transcriptional regulator [Bacteroidales bacterium]|nr:LysR family transcriptional regulator [Bacteroidales bacterium]